jgi:F-type H+-transporting ATPase subunit delta
MATISRRKIAQRVATRIATGDTLDDITKELGAFLIDQRRTKEADLIVRDVETLLLTRGIVLVTAISARELSNETKSSIETLVKQAHTDVISVYIREVIDESVIAGVRIELPDQIMDTTVRAKLDRLQD